jgi:hypothetical protein
MPPTTAPLSRMYCRLSPTFPGDNPGPKEEFLTSEPGRRPAERDRTEMPRVFHLHLLSPRKFSTGNFIERGRSDVNWHIDYPIPEMVS